MLESIMVIEVSMCFSCCEIATHVGLEGSLISRYDGGLLIVPACKMLDVTLAEQGLKWMIEKLTSTIC